MRSEWWVLWSEWWVLRRGWQVLRRGVADVLVDAVIVVLVAAGLLVIRLRAPVRRLGRASSGTRPLSDLPGAGGRVRRARIDRARVDRARVDLGRVDSGRVDLGQVDSGQVDHARVDHARVDHSRVDLGRVDPGQVDPGQVDPVEVDLVTVVELLAVAVESGASVPHAMRSVGAVVGGAAGTDLTRASAALVLGASWPVAWAHAPALGATVDGLAASWTTGAASGPALRASAAEVRRTRDRAAREAAARLGVRLVLPLGLCFLPAFVLVGLVPVLISFAGLLLR